MVGTQRGLETSRWAPARQQSQMLAKPKTIPTLATSLNLSLAPATPKSKSVPSLSTAPALHSSSPAGSETLAPIETQERRESFLNSVHKVALSAEVLQDNTDITVDNLPTLSPAKPKENQLPASALPFTLRLSSRPQALVIDKMAGAKLSSSAAFKQVETTSRAPLDISERLSRVKRSYRSTPSDTQTDEEAKQGPAETVPIEPDRIVTARIEADHLSREKQEAAHRESSQRIEAEKARSAVQEAELSAKVKAQAAAQEAERRAKEKARASAMEAERSAKEKAKVVVKEVERLAKEKAAKEAELRARKEKARAAVKEAEHLAKEKAQKAAKEAERLAKEQARAARLVLEKAKAERLAQEKAAAQVDLQKVIDTAEVRCNALATEINIIKGNHAKHRKEGHEDLEQVELFVEEVKHDQKENSTLLAQALAEVKQAQAVVRNLKVKASRLKDTLAEVNQIVEDKTKNINDLEKDSQAQLTVLEAERNELAKQLAQLVKQFAIMETSHHVVDAQKVDGDSDVVAPEVETKPPVHVNGQHNHVNGQANDHHVEAKAKTNGLINGKSKLSKPLDEPFNANRTVEERANVETDGKLTFKAWPQAAAGREELEFCRIKLTNLPPKTPLKQVVGLVWGGNVQEFVYTPGQSWAEVLFVNPDDCKTYYDSTPNGLIFPGSKDRHIEVEVCPAESARGNVKDIVEKGMTRCVRAMDVDSDWSKLALTKVAVGAGGKRAVESVVLGVGPKSRRIVDFRFAKIADAIIFKAELHRDMDWDMCPTTFGEDPCASHSGIHSK